MNTQIVSNLYEFWTYIGQKTDSIQKTKSYTSVWRKGSDWPNRVFGLQKGESLAAKILAAQNAGLCPLKITTEEDFQLSPVFSQVSHQRNMALDLNRLSIANTKDDHIIKVAKSADIQDFAETASLSFGYNVNERVVSEIVGEEEKLIALIYKENGICLGCGMIFFDSMDQAGLHMIGTIPQSRGKGVGRKITEHLLFEAKIKQKNYSVLHASAKGESIYKCLGFVPYQKIITWALKNK